MKVSLDDSKEIIMPHLRRTLRSITRSKGTLGLLTKKYEMLRHFIKKYEIFQSVPDNRMVWSDFENHKWIRKLYSAECRTSIVYEMEDSINPAVIQQAKCIDKEQCSACIPIMVTYQLVQGSHIHETGKEIFKLIDKKVTLAYIPMNRH